MAKIKQKKNCRICNSEFTTNINRKVYCSPKCVQVAYENVSQKQNTFLSPGTSGAIAELMVCADLLSRGLEVFRSVSPTSNHDLMAIHKGIIYKIEIRTGRYNTDRSKIHYPKQNINDKCLILYTHSDKKIHFITNPEIANLRPDKSGKPQYYQEQ